MTKRIFSLLLALIMAAAAFSGCSKNSNGSNPAKKAVRTTQSSKVDTSSFRLSYSASDSLDPFKSEALNNQVLETLVYDSLFILDESYDAIPSAAQSCSYESPKILKVKLKNSLKFSDGTPLTAENIEYSFNQAKDSPHWSTPLSSFKRVEVDDRYDLTFYLKSANPNAHKLLTFAIAKNKKDENGFKIGSGRYKFIETDGADALTKNEYFPNFNPKFTRINLINVASEESIKSAVNIGNISYAFLDLSGNSKTEILSSTKAVNLNNLVYLGIYCKNGITEDENIRRAINLAIDRDTLVKSAYRGFANAATSPFNPASSISKQTKIFDTTADLTAAKQAIASSGYSADELKLTMLCDKKETKRAAAQLIKQQLEAAGFTVNLRILKSDEYKEYVRSGYYDIFIGETKLTNDMNFSSFFDSDGSLNYGIDPESKTAKAYKNYLKGKGEIGDFLLSFAQETPFVPLLYRQGLICYTKSLQGDMQGYDGNWFSNIEDWYYN